MIFIGFPKADKRDVMIRDGLRQAAIFIDEHKIQPDIAIFQKIFDRRVIQSALRPHDRQKANHGRPRVSVSVNAAVFERPCVHLVTKVERAKRVKQQGQAHEHIRRIRIQAGVMQHLRQAGSINAPDFNGRKDWGQVQRLESDGGGAIIRAHEPANPLHRPTPTSG
jgi:hypothetical protein